MHPVITERVYFPSYNRRLLHWLIHWRVPIRLLRFLHPHIRTLLQSAGALILSQRLLHLLRLRPLRVRHECLDAPALTHVTATDVALQMVHLRLGLTALPHHGTGSLTQQRRRIAVLDPVLLLEHLVRLTRVHQEPVPARVLLPCRPLRARVVTRL